MQAPLAGEALEAFLRERNCSEKDWEAVRFHGCVKGPPGDEYGEEGPVGDAELYWAPEVEDEEGNKYGPGWLVTCGEYPFQEGGASQLTSLGPTCDCRVPGVGNGNSKCHAPMRSVCQCPCHSAREATMGKGTT